MSSDRQLRRAGGKLLTVVLQLPFSSMSKIDREIRFFVSKCVAGCCLHPLTIFKLNNSQQIYVLRCCTGQCWHRLTGAEQDAGSFTTTSSKMAETVTRATDAAIVRSKTF